MGTRWMTIGLQFVGEVHQRVDAQTICSPWMACVVVDAMTIGMVVETGIEGVGAEVG